MVAVFFFLPVWLGAGISSKGYPVELGTEPHPHPRRSPLKNCCPQINAQCYYARFNCDGCNTVLAVVAFWGFFCVFRGDVGVEAACMVG